MHAHKLFASPWDLGSLYTIHTYLGCDSVIGHSFTKYVYLMLLVFHFHVRLCNPILICCFYSFLHFLPYQPFKNIDNYLNETKLWSENLQIETKETVFNGRSKFW